MLIQLIYVYATLLPEKLERAARLKLRLFYERILCCYKLLSILGKLPLLGTIPSSCKSLRTSFKAIPALSRSSSTLIIDVPPSVRQLLHQREMIQWPEARGHRWIRKMPLMLS